MGLTAKLSLEDIILVETYLNDYERELFYKLPKHEQLHGINVGKEVIYECRIKHINDAQLIKAAFLHDIGKIESGLNIINKSLMVMIYKVMPRFLHRFSCFKAVNAYFNHPRLAQTYLKNEDEKLRYYINNHHNYGINDARLKILQEADSKH